MIDNLAVINDPRHSSIGWGAVAVGALVAAASLFLLLAFGTSVGLSVISPWSGQSGSGQSAGPGTFGFLAALWFLLASAASFWAGGFLAGRMRVGYDDMDAREAKGRDSVHGLAVWAIGVVLFIWLGIAAAASAALGQSGPTGAMDAEGYILDTMFRPPSGAPETTPALREQHRDEAARILARSVAPQPLPPEDRSYLERIVANETGLPKDAATQRVESALTTTKQAADGLRKFSVYAGFLTVSALFVAAAASSSGAMRGGRRHRALLPPPSMAMPKTSA